MGGTFGGQCETCSNLYTFGPESKSGQHGITGSYSPGRHERKGSGTAYGGNQAKCGCFFPSVMSSGFETFGYNRIHTGFLTFDGKQGTAHHMDDRYAVFFQERSPFLWTSRRGENDFYSLFDHQVHQAFDFRIHQRYINPEWFVGGSPAFPDMFA